MKRILFSILSFVVCVSLLAYNNGDKFTVNGITYKVISNTNFTVQAVVASATAVVDGTVTVPYEVPDPKDKNVIYEVTDVYLYGSGSIPKTANKLVLSEGIPQLSCLYPNNQITEIYLPTTAKLNNYSNSIINNLRKVVIAEGNPYLKFVPEPADPAGEAGFLTTADGKKYIYHITPRTNIYPDGTIYLPDDVEETSGYLFYYEKSFVKKIHLSKNLKMFGTSEHSSSYITAFEIEDNDKYATFDGVLYIKNKDGQGNDILNEEGNPTYELCAYPHGKADTKFVVWDQCVKLGKQSCESTKFTEIDLNRVETVENNAFRFNNLQKVVFTDYVKEYSNSQNGGSLTTFVFRDDDNNPNMSEQQRANVQHANFDLVDGVLISKDGKTVVACPPGRFKGETYTLPEGVETLSPYAFEYSSFSKFVSNSTLTTMTSSAFYYSKLVECDFSESTKLATLQGLRNCGSLKVVTLCPGITKLGSFTECNSLESITVPDGSQLVSIDNSAFAELKSLKSFVFEGSAPNFTTVGSRAFSNCVNLEELVLPPTTTTIGASAFYGCTQLKDVNMANNNAMVTISANAFADSGLETIVLPSTVTTIDAEAFMNCEGLKTVVIPAATTKISPEAFKYCATLTEIIVDKANTKYSSVGGYLLDKKKTKLILFPPGKAGDNYTLLPPSITAIGDNAFYGCENLTNIVIPNKVTSIGKRSFGLCSALKTITFLCENAVTINDKKNQNSFDADVIGNIDVNVRMNLYDTYRNDAVFKKFKSITPSFKNGGSEFIALNDEMVDLVDVQDDVNTYVVPATAKNASIDKEYNVALFGDYACQNAPASVKEVVMFNNVEYVGARAFRQNKTQTINSIFFVQGEPTTQLLATTRFEITPDDLPLVKSGKNYVPDTQYMEFDSKSKVYVRKSVYDKCCEDWAAYKDMIDYKIKDSQIKTQYGTFSREFDVDFSDCAKANGNKVLAFTAALSDNVTSGTGDYGESEYVIRMESIYCGKFGKDGAYIPKNTGALIKCMDGEATSDFYYCISDRNDDNLQNYGGKNVMHGVTVKAQQLTGSDAMSVYVMQKGLFRYVDKSTTLTMPVHKAYLVLNNVPAGAKVRFASLDDETNIQADSEIVDVVDLANVIEIINGRAPNVDGIADVDGKNGVNIEDVNIMVDKLLKRTNE